MMTTLIIVRHGQSMANVQGFFAGNMDAPLSPLGYSQAEKTAAYIAENYRVDKIYSSDLSRAFDTAKAIGEKTGVVPVPDEDFREMNAGEWEGKAFDVLDDREDYILWKKDIGNSKAAGGESFLDVMERAVLAFKRVAQENDGKVVVVVTHAHPIRAARCKWENMTLSQAKDVPWVSNASVTIAEYDNGEFTLKSEGYDEHLSDCKTCLPTFV